MQRTVLKERVRWQPVPSQPPTDSGKVVPVGHGAAKRASRHHVTMRTALQPKVLRNKGTVLLRVIDPCPAACPCLWRFHIPLAHFDDHVISLIVQLQNQREALQIRNGTGQILQPLDIHDPKDAGSPLHEVTRGATPYTRTTAPHSHKKCSVRQDDLREAVPRPWELSQAGGQNVPADWPIARKRWLNHKEDMLRPKPKVVQLHDILDDARARFFVHINEEFRPADRFVGITTGLTSEPLQFVPELKNLPSS